MHRRYSRFSAKNSTEHQIDNSVYRKNYYISVQNGRMKNIRQNVNRIADELGINPQEIKQRKDFLELGPIDHRELSQLSQVLDEDYNDFLDGFYEHILKFENTRKIIIKESDLERLKSAQLVYFKSLTGGHYDWDYVLDRLQLGLVHQKIGLDTKWYVGAYRKYISLLMNRLDDFLNVDRQKFIQILDSIFKIVLFDMSLVVDAYAHANHKAVQSLEQNLNELIQGIDGFIWEFDVALYRYLYVSQQAQSMLGYDQNRWIEDPEFQHKITHPDDIEQVKLAFDDAIARGFNQEIEYRIVVKNGQTLWVNERINIVKNSDGDVGLLRGLISDIQRRKEYEAQLAYMATYDELTGLPNRNYFERRLRESMVHSKRMGTHLAIMFLDLDGFKDINDSLGHAAGDQLIKTIGQRIKGTLREQEFAARFGGDEFCIVVMDITEDYVVAHVASRCLKVLEKSTSIVGQEIFPRASIGIAMFPQDGETPELLLQCADNAMYAAKSAGKHQFAFYDIEMTSLAEGRLALENDLRLALKRQEFELYYQPQIGLNSGKLVAVEALIRWHHPVRGIVAPDEFISVTEKIGLIVPLSEWVLNQACRQIAEWRRSSVDVGCVAINISGAYFCHSTLPDAVVQAIRITGIEARDLELEITESVVQTSAETIDNFDKIKQIGIKISIDDFGTGYSSLGSLTQLPIDSLKIDKAFIRNMLTDTNYSTIVGTIVAMSRALGFTVVAEGVETRDQVTYLQGIGCGIVQGYYFSKPVPADQIPKLAATDFFLV